ncbi:hypothetical protein LWI29_033640 [Acer saccharum]|uniref:Uncharacterized protein n=1 Tax=Acer saccharum TaxID=4024 RepID=A0AA39WAH8_ACESA|nr:hypothetical protein LWI29_033640 [Acer saccharum]
MSSAIGSHHNSCFTMTTQLHGKSQCMVDEKKKKRNFVAKECSGSNGTQKRSRNRQTGQHINLDLVGLKPTRPFISKAVDRLISHDSDSYNRGVTCPRGLLPESYSECGVRIEREGVVPLDLSESQLPEKFLPSTIPPQAFNRSKVSRTWDYRLKA